MGRGKRTLQPESEAEITQAVSKSTSAKKPKAKRKLQVASLEKSASDREGSPVAVQPSQQDAAVQEPTTPASKARKKGSTPRKPSKETVGRTAALALASQGDLDAAFLLYDNYPHSRAFEMTSSQTPNTPLAGPSTSTSPPGLAAPSSAAHHGAIQHRLTFGLFSSVLTYHAEDTLLIPPVHAPQRSGSPGQAVPAGALVEPVPVNAPAEEVATSRASASPPHHPQQDEEELPDAVKSAVQETAKRTTRRKGKRSQTVQVALEDSDPGAGTAELDAAQLAASVEDVEPLDVNTDLTDDPVDVQFNKQLKDKPWPAVVPNMGYACLCATLRAYGVYCSRDCVQKTFLEKGLQCVSSLALANARDLLALIRWNARHGIQLFRLSSNIFPWMAKYQMEDLPDFPAIKQALFDAGEAARAAGQRLTFHPSEFCKIAGASDRDHWTEHSIAELEVHSKIFDLMGYAPSCWNKINIHVGGSYGDKDASLRRFAKVVNERLSPACKARMAVENDDKASLYSVKDLLLVHELCGIPITFDFHHHKFCTGGMDELTAFKAAMATWPSGVRPVVHWSEARDDRRPQAHSDYVHGPIFLHGYEADVDVMIESKAKELALLAYREMAIQKAAEAKQVQCQRA